MNVFISYRREDSQHQADRLCEILRSVFSEPDQSIFIDIDNIPFGVDFEQHLISKVKDCEVLLALIGPHWLESLDPEKGTRRLDSPNDFVRIEIVSALERGIRVIPVLLDGAPIPSESELPEPLKPLSKRNGIQVNRMSFKSDVMRLVYGLGFSEQSIEKRAEEIEVTNVSGATSTSDSAFFNDFLMPVLKCLQKDNAIWSRILGLRQDESTLEFKVAAQIERDEILPNHQKIINLIEAWRHVPIVDEDTQLAEVLDAYLDHITVYKTIRSAGDDTSLPIDVGAPWPDTFYEILQDRIHRYENTASSY